MSKGARREVLVVVVVWLVSGLGSKSEGEGAGMARRRVSERGVYAVVVVGAEERRRERSGRVARRILGVCRVVDFVVYW
jgi:hypothetical protein